MAEDHTQRPFRATDASARPASERAASGGNDPLAELARLIGQNDPFGEFGRPPVADPHAPAQPEQGAHEYYHAPSTPGAPPTAGEAVDAPQDVHPGYDVPPMAVSDRPPYAHQGYDPGAHPEMHPDPDPNMPPYGTEELDFYDDVPPRRRMGVLAIAAVFALAVLGTAGAVGYRALFGSSNSGPPPVIKAETAPSKVVPADKKNAQSAKLIQDRVTDKGAGEKLVSREEQPIDMNKPAGVFPQAPSAASSGSVQPAMLGSGVIASDPKKVRTIAIRPDGMVAPAGTPAMPAPTPPASAPSPGANDATPAQPASEPEQAAGAAPAATEPPPPARETAARAAPARRNGPLSLSPGADQTPAAPAPAAPAPAPRQRTAAAPTQLAPQASSAASGSPAGGYAVQVSSRRSEADAQAAFRSLQSQFPDQLGGRQPLIRRVDLGEKGIYYRTMVGPFGSSSEAKQLCEALKAAGGNCFIQRI